LEPSPHRGAPESFIDVSSRLEIETEFRIIGRRDASVQTTR
jgi:hypothetical protein